MHQNVYLRNGVAYFPTVAKTEAGFYVLVEPVVEVSVSNVIGLRNALGDIIARDNVIIPTPKRNAFPPSLLPKHAGVKTDRAFMQGASQWAIDRKNGNYQIIGYRVHQDGYWVQDGTQKIGFPKDAPTDSVVDRMIAILQDAARE